MGGSLSTGKVRGQDEYNRWTLNDVKVRPAHRGASDGYLESIAHDWATLDVQRAMNRAHGMGLRRDARARMFVTRAQFHEVL